MAQRINLKMDTFLETRTSKAGKEYQVLVLEKGNDFKKFIFMEVNELNLIRLLSKIEEKEDNTIDLSED